MPVKVAFNNFGPIARLAKVGEVVPQKPHDIWTGGISLATRTKKDLQLKVRVTRNLRPSELEKYFVPCDIAARMRCIDGRILEHYAEDASLQNRPLGPQVPGGTAMAALAHRIVHADRLSHDISFGSDIDYVVQGFREKGMGFGGHIDNHDHPNDNTGCGAIDKTPEILERIAEPAAQQQLRGLASMLLGNRYDDATLDIIIGRIINLQSIASRYFMTDVKTGQYDYRQAVVRDLIRNAQEGGNPIARLVGPHHEVGLVVNTVRGTTFDPDRFSFDNKNELQLFNYDFWSTQHGATILYPVNNDVSYADAKRNLRFQHQYLTCRVLLAIGTAMVLTDGSVQLIVRHTKK